MCNDDGPGGRLRAGIRLEEDGEMRTVKRPRRYVHRRWLSLFRPILRYSQTRHAYVLRGVGSNVGPVLRADRRERRRPQFEGPERRVPAGRARTV
jgi:hypothetical protein